VLQLLNTQNINQIFQLLFNVIVNSETGVTRQYAVDLFTDLLQFEPRVQQSLIKSVTMLLNKCKSHSQLFVNAVMFSECTLVLLY